MSLGFTSNVDGSCGTRGFRYRDQQSFTLGFVLSLALNGVIWVSRMFVSGLSGFAEVVGNDARHVGLDQGLVGFVGSDVGLTRLDEGLVGLSSNNRPQKALGVAG